MQCDCYEKLLDWTKRLQHYELLRYKIFANTRMTGCMESPKPQCRTYYTQHHWELLVPPFIKSKNAQDMYTRCNMYKMVDAIEPRRFGISPPVIEHNYLEEEEMD